MSVYPVFRDPIQPYTRRLLECLRLLERDGIEGDVVECGVAQGRNLFRLAGWCLLHAPARLCYGLDTFEGLPAADFGPRDAGTPMVPGEWRGGMELFLDWPLWRPNVRLIRGRAQDSLDRWPASAGSGGAREPSRPIALLWLDMDLYAPMRYAAEWAARRLQPGAILGINDYGRPECPGTAPALACLDRRDWSVIDWEPGDYSIYLRRRDRVGR